LSERWTLKYGSAAVVTAIFIIAVALVVNPPRLLPPSYEMNSYVVMLTNPPVAPEETALLYLTYSGVLLHITYPNGMTEWLPVNASGTVNMSSLTNMTQTIASTAVPVGSTIDQIQFEVTELISRVNGSDHDVTPLSNSLVVKVNDGNVSQPLSGVLLDFNPTLARIQAANDEGDSVDNYVMVPSAAAIAVTEISDAQLEVDTVFQLKEDQRSQLASVEEEFKKNVNIVTASMSVEGDTTNLAVTIKNEGTDASRVFGITLHGEFKMTQTRKMQLDEKMDSAVKIHPQTIPFKLQGTSLFPLLGTKTGRDEAGALMLEPGKSVTLTFMGIMLQTQNEKIGQGTIITPIVGNTYVLSLMGEGIQIFEIMVTS
jgi:hypothetical protein